jgi:hypothetical protein
LHIIALTAAGKLLFPAACQPRRLWVCFFFFLKYHRRLAESYYEIIKLENRLIQV